MKQNDYLLNIISNQEFTNEDFRLVGLDSTNTSLEKKDVYKNLDYIRNQEMFQTDGVFDEYKFDTFYDAVSLGYNELATLDSAKLLGDKLVSSKYNIFADINTVNPNGEFIIHKTLNNPLRQKTSVWGGNQITEGPLSIREIAQTQLTSYEDGLKESPNDAGFFGDFFGTKVLATYDSDGVHTDPTTGLQVEHKKGEYKYNHNGTFYYEDLAGRDIYGKQVLSKFDVITTDGSALNTYDFFDSDDKEKGMTGTLMKSVVKVAPAFIPYVGPWYIAARIGLNSMDLFSKIGKMVAGSDSPNLSAIEGFAASLGTSTSDYAQEHLWSVENLLNMGADVFLQLAEQRWLFTHLPSLLKGNKLGFDEKARDIWKEKNVSEYLKKLSQRQYGLQSDDMLQIDYALRAKAVGETNRVLEGILKDNYKIGEYISKAYMTGITTASGYSEAKNSGASDTEAMLFTLGLAAGEYGILSTRLGNWILPELQLEKARLQKVIRTLHGLNPGPAAPPAAKKNWAMQVIKAGKDWFTSAGFDENTGKVLAKHMVSNSLGEGFEETVEQAWLDIAKSIYNFVGELRGDENTLRQTWRNPDGSLNIANTLNDYALNFVGGLIGGGLGNLKLSFKESQNIANLNDSKAAYQELLYHIREGNGTKLKEVASKMQLGDPTKGTTLVNDYAYAEGTSTDNQDLQAKSVFNGYIDHLTKLVNMERSVKNDKGISLDLVFKDLRFAKLLESEILKSYLQNYHTAVVDLISTASDIEVLENKGTQTDSDKLTADEVKRLNELKHTYTETKKKVEEYTDGTQGLEFVKDAIFEMDGGVNNGYAPNNILQYIQFKELSLGYTRKLNEIPKVELEKYIKDWENKAYNLKDQTRALRKWFDANNTLINTHIKNHVFDYLNDADVFIGKVDTAISQKIDENLRVGDSQFANFLQHLYSDKSKEDADTNYSKRVAIMDALTQELVDTDETFRPLFDLFQAVRRTENAATIALGSDYYNPVVNGQVVTDLRGNSTTYANIVENLMYDAGLMEINDASILSNHDLLYRKAVRQILTNPRVVDHLQNTLKNQGFLSHSARSFLNEFMDQYLDESEAKTQILDTISKIPYTPIQNLLDDVQLTLKDSSIKFSTLVSALEAQAFKLSNSGTLNEFGFPAVTWEEAIQHAEDLGNVTLSHLAAARTDLTDPQMPWGYNYTVNQLTKSDDLVTYTVDGFNMLYSDLEKQMNSLSIYKRMVRNSASQLLNSQYNTQASILHRLVSDLKSIFFTLSTDPDNALQNWEKADEFKQALLTLLPESGTSDLETLKEHKGLFTDQDKLRIFQLQFELDNAIFNFMQANKSKTSEDFITLFTKLIPTDRQRLWFIREQDNYEQGNNLHIKTIFSYLAAAGSLSSASFMDFYRKSIKDQKKFIHSNGLYNALFHEVSFLSKKDLWDKMTAAYDAIQQRDLADTNVSDSRVINKGDFYNDSDAKRNTSSALTYKDCFLTTGLSGTGKSSANITLLLSILKNVGNLTNKIAIVHKTQEQADDVVKYLVEEAGLGLTSDNFQAFTHESYLNHINPNIIPVDPNNPVIDESTLEQKDDKTWHYKEEDSLNESAAKFSLVIVDEVTNISHVDLSVHQNYINTNNIRSICLGDFNQTTLQGSFTQADGIVEHLQIHAHNFFQTLSLMQSFRSTNQLNTNSQLEFLKAVPAILAKEEGHYIKGEGAVDMIYDEDDQIQSNYLLNDHEFGGILVDDVDLNTLNSDTDIEKIPEDIKLAIQHMLNTTSDKIFVLGNHPNNVLYKYLKSLNQESKFEYIDGVAQGRESDYAIVITEDSDINSAELGKRYGECLDFFKDTYTAISRARIGSIVTNPKIVNSEYSKRVFKPSKKFTVNKASVLTDQIISEFNSKTIAIFDSILTGVEITPINLDYEITTQESKMPLDITQLKKEIAEFKKEVEEYIKEDLVPNLPKDKYDKWIESVEKSTLPDGEKIDLLNQIKEFEQYVPTTNNNEGTNFMDADIPYTNTKEDQMIAPIYSFNSYLAGINEEMHIMYGTSEEKSTEPNDWGGEMLGLRGIIKMLNSEGVDLKDYYDKSSDKPEVKSKAITELHKLYYQLYTGQPIKSPFVPKGYKVVIGFRNTSGTKRDMHTSANGKNGTNHRIVAYIMKDSEIKVQIPLYTLPNINAIIKSYLVGVGELSETEADQAVNEIQGLNDPSDKLQYLQSKNWDYTALVKLLTIYTNSGSDELFLKKDGDQFIWESTYDPDAEYCTSIRQLLGDASQLFGIQVASQTKDSNGYYTYSPEPVKLVEQVNSSKNRVGNIYVHPHAFAFHSDHTIEIKVNNSEVIKKTIPAGKQFVVLSQNPDIRSDYSLDRLLKEVSENKATIVYINCPILNNNATDNIEGLVRMFSKDVKSITSHQCILSIANALLDDNVSKYFTNDIIFTEKERPKLRNSIKILKELVQGLQAGKTWTDTTDMKQQLGVNPRFSSVSYGTGVKILTQRLLTKLFDNKVSDSTRTDAVTQLFENLKGKPLYFSFEQHGDKQYLEGSYEGYYNLNVTFDLEAGSIQATVSNIGTFDVYINGELRTCQEFGNITPILNLVDTPIQQRQQQGPKPQTSMYYKVNGYDFLYKKIDKSGESYVLMNNGEEYKVSLNNMTSTVDPQGQEFTTVTSISSSHANFKTMFNDYQKLYENNLLDEKIDEDQYISLKFPDYQKQQDGTYKYDDKVYEYDSNTYSMIEQVPIEQGGAQQELYNNLINNEIVIKNLQILEDGKAEDTLNDIRETYKSESDFDRAVRAAAEYIFSTSDTSYNELDELLGKYLDNFINKIYCN